MTNSRAKHAYQLIEKITFANETTYTYTKTLLRQHYICIIVFIHFRNANNSGALNLELNGATANYDAGGRTIDNAGTETLRGDNNAADISLLTNSIANWNDIILTIFPPDDTEEGGLSIISHGHQAKGITDDCTGTLDTIVTAATGLTSFKLSLAAGNFTAGTMHIYGVKN